MTDETVQPPAEVPLPAETPQVPQEPLPASGYRDDDLVYVDPENRTVVGRVEFSNSGRPKSLAMKEEDDDDDAPPAPAAAPAADAKPAKGDRGRRRGREGRDGRPRKKRVRYYPWGTYRSMKKIYKIEGKVIEERGNQTLDEILPKALNEAFWD